MQIFWDGKDSQMDLALLIHWKTFAVCSPIKINMVTCINTCTLLIAEEFKTTSS